jgi:hypothetical protein
MGFLGSVFGKSGEKAAGYAPQNNFRAQATPLADEQRKMYAEKIAAAQSGQGPSVANQFVQNAQNNNLANAAAMANSARGDVNPAMNIRNAQNAVAMGNQQAVAQGGQMRAQEGLELTKLYEQLGMQGDLANQNNMFGTQQINAGVTNQNSSNASDFGKQGMTSGGTLLGGILNSFAAPAAIASDEKLKENVTGAASDIDAFLDSLKAHKYEYKDKAYGEGKHVSPMAQDLEKTPVGEQMVMDTPKGKMVDYGRGFGAILAAQATLNERLKKLESSRG